MLFARPPKMKAAPFEFLEPGELRDGDLRLSLYEKSPAVGVRAPTYRFSMHHAEEGQSLGAIEFRVGQSTEILLYTGHIGYHVDAPFRGHRYAARGSRLLLDLAKRHGFAELWVTCDPDNLPSYRTCELIGGQLIETIPVPRHHPYFQSGSREKCRFRVPL